MFLIKGHCWVKFDRGNTFFFNIIDWDCGFKNASSRFLTSRNNLFFEKYRSFTFQSVPISDTVSPFMTTPVLMGMQTRFTRPLGLFRNGSDGPPIRAGFCLTTFVFFDGTLILMLNRSSSSSLSSRSPSGCSVALLCFHLLDVSQCPGRSWKYEIVVTSIPLSCSSRKLPSTMGTIIGDTSICLRKGSFFIT